MGNSAFNIVALIILFIFSINFGAFTLVLTYGVVNDYMLYQIVDTAEDLESEGTLPAIFATKVQDIANKFKDTFEIYDNVLFVFWLLFMASTFYLSYIIDKDNYFNFFGTLLFVGMIFLFFIGLFVTFSDWWHVQILENLLPSFNVLFPKYGWIINNLGIFSAVQLGICVLINQLDFDFAGFFSRKKKEQDLVDNEVL